MILIVSVRPVLAEQDSLPPLTGESIPQNYDELWSGYDPQGEPLDVEILREWEENGVSMKVLRYRIGIFKGEKAMMAAVYGYPKNAENVPGLVQIHGGGQYADHRAVLTNAMRGYATISISWAGRISAPDYAVNPDVVKLFWQGETDDARYRVTTDWGPLDAYHAPCRNPGNAFAHVRAAPWTLDSDDSPRNNPWFLCTMGARRALTFLERQPQVDGNRLGVYGHSMGGKLTVMTAGSDPRVKAAAPSCGGISDRDSATSKPLYRRTISDDVYLQQIRCPIIFLNPTNDFHGRIDDLKTAVNEIQSKQFRLACSPHHNHQDTKEYEVATQLWFDQQLKHSFEFPLTPDAELHLQTDRGVPSFLVRPDLSKALVSLDIFYTQQGREGDMKEDHENAKARFWHHAEATRNGDSWTGELPLFDLERPLWVYANATYQMDDPVTGAGYYYGTYTTDQYTISTLLSTASSEELVASHCKPTLLPESLVESFEAGWQKEWFSYRPEMWPRRTHKVYDPVWSAGEMTHLAFDVMAKETNTLVIGLDQYAAEVSIAGGEKWQAVALSPVDFQDVAGVPLTDWAGIKELRLGDQETLRDKDVRRSLGQPWRGNSPKFRQLRWTDGVSSRE